MPMARCKHFWSSGTPLGNGCPARASCNFIHPEEKDRWESLPPYKTNVRCNKFDRQGNPIVKCVDGTRDCRFVHPDDPSWTRASIPAIHYPEYRRVIPPEKPSTPVALPSRRAVSSTTSSRSIAVDTSRISLPKLQTDISKARSPSLNSPLRSLEYFFPEKHKEAPASFNASDYSFSMERGLGVTAESLASVRISTPDSMNSSAAPLSTLSQSTSSSKRLAWKRLISSLSQAVTLRQQVRDLNRRTSLYSLNSTATLSNKAPIDELMGVSQDKLKDVEDKLNFVITQLMEMDFWPFPSAREVTARLEQSARLGLTNRLDEVEAQLKECAEMGILVGQTPAIATDTDMARPSSRSLKRRRTSTNGSFIQVPDVKDVKERLDRVEDKLSEMEEGQIWHDDRIGERLDELLEKANDLANAEPKHSRGRGASPTEPFGKSETVLRNLDRDFMALCEEFAGHLPAVGMLEAELGKLRLDYTDSRQTVASLEASCQQLREQTDSHSRQADDISSLIINRPVILDPQPSDPEFIIRTVGEDLKQHIGTVREELMNLISSQFRDVRNAVITEYESTIAKTDAICDIMLRRARETQVRLNGATREG